MSRAIAYESPRIESWRKGVVDTAASVAKRLPNWKARRGDLVINAAAISIAVYFAVSVGAAAALIPAPTPHYDNPNYDFSVDVPKQLLACVSDATNHGIDILLDLNLHCNRDYSNSPYVDIYGSYNVATNAVTAQMLARIYCGYEKAQRTVWLSGWTLGGRMAAGCRQYFKDGQITVTIATQRKTEPENPEAWINISASLTTTASRYKSDMRVFREIVQMVRIAPDGPRKTDRKACLSTRSAFEQPVRCHP